MNIVIIICRQFERAELAAAKLANSREWMWFANRATALDWIDRCRERGIDVQETWVF